MATIQEALETALAHHQAGRYSQAADIYRQVLAINPVQVHALHLLGLVAHQTGDHQTAVHHISRAVAIDPSQAYMHSNLGGALRALGRLDEARSACEQAIRLAPSYLDAYGNLGLILREQKEFRQAAEVYREATRVDPNVADMHHNLGYVLGELGQIEEAIAADLEAVRLRPDHHDALVHLSIFYTDLQRLDEALVFCERALEVQPDSAEGHSSRALIWLTQENYRQGFPEYEWRWKTKTLTPRPFFTPRWDGSPLAGRTILVHAEQGLGDLLQFVRYAPILKAQGARVVVDCPARMRPIVSTCAGIDQLVSPGELLPQFDVHAPLLSVPGLVGTTVETIPANVPYLSADPELVAKWRQGLSSLAGFKIGIAWQGNATYRGDIWRSIPLAQFAPLAAIEGVRLIGLQKGAGQSQVAELGGRFEVLDLSDRLDESTGAFMDTAAVMQSLDLVVTSDTAIAHLAGALGLRVWVALSVAVDWRWLTERSDSPWYPTMRLFRQQQLGQWEPVFAEIGAAVQEVK